LIRRDQEIGRKVEGVRKSEIKVGLSRIGYVRALIYTNACNGAFAFEQVIV